MFQLLSFIYPWWGIIFILFIGFGWLIFLEQKFNNHFANSLALPTSFMLGIASSSLLLYTFSLAGISWQRLLVLGITISTSLLGYCLGFSHLKLHFHSLRLHLPLGIFIVIMIIVGIYIFKLNLRHELLHSDNLANWFLRGKIFFVDKGFSLDRLNHIPFSVAVENPDPTQLDSLGFTSFQYPILVPLAISMNHLIYNQAAIIPAKYLWIAIELVIASLLWHIGRYLFPKLRFSGLIGPILFYTIPITPFRFGIHQFGYADVWLSAFNLLALWYLWLYIKKSQPLTLLISGIFICCSVMTKIEGMVILASIPILLLSIKKYPKLSLGLILGILIIPTSWYYIATNIHSQSGAINQTFGSIFTGYYNFQNLGNIIIGYLVQLLDIPTQGLIWIVFFLTFIYRTSLKQFISFQEFWHQFIVIIGVGFMMLLYFFHTYSFTSPLTLIQQNIGRFSSQWYPALIMFILINLAPKPTSKSSRNRRALPKP